MQPASRPQQQVAYGGGYAASYHHTDVQIYDTSRRFTPREVLKQIAMQYVQGTSGNDPTKLPRNVDTCYMFASGASDRQEAIQRCMILDYTAYKEILAGSRIPTFPERDYFSREASGARWAQYGPVAGFKDPDRMFDYLRSGYGFVRDEANYIRSFNHPRLALR